MEFNWGMPPLTARDAAANHFASDILSLPRTDIPNISPEMRQKDPSASVTIRNRSCDAAFLTSFCESHLIELLAASGAEIVDANSD